MDNLQIREHLLETIPDLFNKVMICNPTYFVSHEKVIETIDMLIIQVQSQLKCTNFDNKVCFGLSGIYISCMQQVCSDTTPENMLNKTIYESWEIEYIPVRNAFTYKRMDNVEAVLAFNNCFQE